MTAMLAACATDARAAGQHLGRPRLRTASSRPPLDVRPAYRRPKELTGRPWNLKPGMPC